MFESMFFFWSHSRGRKLMESINPNTRIAYTRHQKTHEKVPYLLQGQVIIIGGWGGDVGRMAEGVGVLEKCTSRGRRGVILVGNSVGVVDENNRADFQERLAMTAAMLTLFLCSEGPTMLIMRGKQVGGRWF